MTISNGYCTLDEFKNYLRAAGQTLSIDTTDDAVIEAMIEDVSRAIDYYSQRQYYASTDTKYFDTPINTRELKLGEDLLSIDTLTNGDGTEISSDYYTLYPLNETAKRSIILNMTAPIAWLTNNGEPAGAISVLGDWGKTDSAPEYIRKLCKRAVLNEYNRHGPGENAAATITAAGVVLTPKTDAMIINGVNPDKRRL